MTTHRSRTVPRMAILSATACAALALSACAGQATAGPAADSMAEMDPITITISDMSPESAPSGQAWAMVAEYVEEESDGKITFESYFSSALMPGEEMLTGVGSRVADTGLMVTSYFPQELPIANFLNDLGALPNTSFPLGELQASAATSEMFAQSEELVAEFESHNLKVLNGGYSHRYPLLCSKPIDSLADAQGMRARTGGPVWGDELEAMGMVPVPLPVGEMYEGLQRGVVDCVVLNPPSIVDFGLWEVAKHYYQVDMSGFVGSVLIFNLDTWNSLPPDAQELMQEGADRYWAVSRERTIEKYAAFATAGVEEHGVEFGDTREFDEVLAEFQEDKLANIAELAPGSLGDPQQFVERYQDLLDKWLAILVDDLGFEEADKDPESVRQSFVEVEGLDVSPVIERLAEEQRG